MKNNDTIIYYNNGQNVFEVRHMRKFLLLILVLLAFPFFSKTLLLYKGSEGGYGYNILSWLAPELEVLGEDYEFVDVEKSLPDFEDYDFVITCYYSSSMPGAKKYLKKLVDFLLNGGKLFIINNLGAFEDSSGDNPSLSDINSLLNLLGVSFRYGWRQETVFSYEIEDGYLIKLPSLPVKKAFDGFEVFSSNVKIVSYAVTEKGKHPVIFYGPFGGMALFDHAFNENGKPVVDLRKIVKDIVVGYRENKVLMLGENHHIRKIFEYALFEVDSSRSGVLQKYRAIVIPNVSFLEEKEIKSYLENGGVVILVGSGAHYIRGEVVLEKENLYIPQDITVGERKVGYIPAPENAKAFITINGTPVSWMEKREKGAFVFFPEDLLGKWSRGILFNEFLEASDFVISPMVNAFSVFLDDFPLPAYGIEYDILGTTDEIFYYKIWWRDMKELCEDFSIKPITALVTSYEQKTNYDGFFEFLQKSSSIKILKNLIEDEGVDTGIHGYNHVPPKSENWDLEELGKAYKSLRIFLSQLSSSYEPVAFVAPNNEIDQSGIEVLKSVFPTIKVIGTAYSLEDSTGEFTLLDDVLILPRTTSGCYPLQRLLMETVSTLLNLGTYHHFSHPDDVISLDRNPERYSWNEMFDQLRSFFRIMKENYPWLRNMDSEELYNTFKDYFENKPRILYHDKKIVIVLPRTAELPRYFFLKAKGDVNVHGGVILFRDKDLCVVEMRKYKMEISEVIEDGR